MTMQSPIGFMTPADRIAADAMNNPRATVRAIAKEVCDYTGHSINSVMGKSRLASDCRVRELVCYIAHRQGMSLPQIGRALHRDHTTILSAVRNERARRGDAEELSPPFPSNLKPRTSAARAANE